MTWEFAIRSVLATGLALLSLTGAQAQDYPNRPITLMVGLAPGGITDITARLYAEQVSKTIGQRVVVENKQGGGGAVAAAAVQNAAPDGYTLLIFSGSQHSAVPAVQAAASYEPIKGFQPITLLFDLAAFITVPIDNPAKTVNDLLEQGRKKPGGLLFGSPGVGTPSHLLAAKISSVTNTPMQYVHYRGGAPMMADLVTGRVDFALASYTVAKGFFVENKMKALAVEAPARVRVLPDVPTLTEAGLGHIKVASWFALAAPAGTPTQLVQKIRDEFIKASKDPDLQRRLEGNGTPIHTSTPEEMSKLLAAEVEAMKQLVSQLGLKQ